MSTIKSSAENLTLNADGANNDVIIQSNGSTKVTVDGQNSRVGIGTASPTKKLEIVVAGTDGVLMSGANGYVGSTNDLIIDMDSNNDYSGNAIKFTQHDGASELMRIQDSGGISFNGDTAAANALDDYEEGTWTPVLKDQSNNVSPSFSFNNTAYTKIGRMVTISSNIINISTVGLDINEDFRVYGIPFSVVTQGIGSVEMKDVNYKKSYTDTESVSSLATSSYVYFRVNRNNGGSQGIETDDLNSTTSGFHFTVTYFV